MQLLPDGRRRQASRQPVDQQQLLTDPKAALQELRLDPLELRVTLEQRFETRRILAPESLPESERALGSFQFTVGRWLWLPRVSARELGMKVKNRLAKYFGDAPTLARTDGGFGQKLQLRIDRFEMLGDVGQRQPAQPSRARFGVGEAEAGRLGAALREREVVGHRLSVAGGA